MAKVSTARMFLSEAMNLHAERVRRAREREHQLFQEHDAAKAERIAVERAYEKFKQYVTAEGF